MEAVQQLDMFGVDPEYAIQLCKQEIATLRRGLFARHNELEKSVNLLMDIIEDMADRIKELEKK